jgi:hypothetical protein
VQYTFVIYMLELIAILIIALSFKSKLDWPYLAIGALVFMTIISESLSTISAHQIKSNSAIFHLFTAVEFSLFSLIYYLLLKNPKFKTLVFVCVFLFAGFVVLNALYFQPVSQMPFNNNMLASVLLMTYAFLLFLEMINLEIKNSLFALPSFWFNSGILIFNTAMLIFWGIYHLVQFNPNNGILHIAMWLLNLIFYAFIGISIYLNGKKGPSY